ncbi:hypothetical protein [Ruegeria sp. HKCCD6428]|uniref:hypothetical protein n=1 Tax=Ruegeria sp. HKCCD6428 TaxID=2683002 RepID=UPI001491E162|nr:hypothetical protein [Ruegeria sp. HKCCD6428]NOC83339.1 hypothetical protein [Ruegeria sp. HKCCD6428]
MQTFKDDIFLTTTELADRWKVSAKWLANQRSARNSPVPFTKIAGAVRYKLIDVRDYEHKQREVQTDRQPGCVR